MSDLKKHVFRYRQLEIYKSHPLGRGSYGAVYKAKCDQLPCAAKILHDELINSQNPGVNKVIKMFEQECEFLSGFRHPHIVQYLGTAKCPERSKLPILIMELLEENLTKMLEKAKHPLPYYLEVDLCHDIALAVSYLHSNDILHRDLSSNNVLITAGKRAKVTDFGMSKLISSNAAAIPQTMCPGSPLYMPPEARKDPAEYTEKLDCYSEGVLMIQICSREAPREGERDNQIRKIRSMHPLLPIARRCLNDNQLERPSAEELCQRLEILQEGTEYKLSVLPTAVDSKDIDEMERQNKVLQKRLDQQDQQIKEQADIIEDIKQTNSSLERQVNELLGGNQTRKSSLKQSWSPGRNLPKEMVRGDVAMDGDVAYFMSKDGTLYKYDSTVDPQEAWHQLVKCPYESSCLVVMDGLLTAIGGLYRGMGNSVTNRLISLKGAEIRTWETHFPKMPINRYHHAAVTTSSKHLIVIGGITKVVLTGALEAVNKVDVLNYQASPPTWSTVASLIFPFCKMSATVCGNQLYVMGGDHRSGVKTVLACSLNALIPSKSNTAPTSVWRQLTDVPQYYTTCVSSKGELLAVGGTSDTRNPNAQTEVYRYNQTEGSWNLYTNMITPRYSSLVAVFPGKNLLVVVGGYDHNMSCDITELCQL